MTTARRRPGARRAVRRATRAGRPDAREPDPGQQTDQTRDDTDEGWGEPAAGPGEELAWWQAQRPPHWE